MEINCPHCQAIIPSILNEGNSCPVCESLIDAGQLRIAQLEARIRELEGVAGIDPNDPDLKVRQTPASQDPCIYCNGPAHPPDQPIICVCVMCEQLCEIVHCGFCQRCFDGTTSEHGSWSTPAPPGSPAKMPWET